MRAVFKFLPFLLILPAGTVPPVIGVNGQQQAPAQPHVPSSAQIAKAQARDLDQLFALLRYSENAEEASKTEAEIFIRLTQSSSPTVNLLLESANFALSNQDNDIARSMLTDAVKLDPEFAEGLTRAASLAYQDGDLDEAQGLLKRALRIEPRHFGAWAGLALVLEDQGDLESAQKAYREALYLHPFLDGAKRGLIRLEAKLEGLSL